MRSLKQQLEEFSHQFTPALITTAIVLITVIPLRIPGIKEIMPNLAFINIYYWGVFYPGTLPYGFLFALGILQDSLTGNPLGMSSFINMVFAFMLGARKRVFGQALFGSLWTGFAVLSLAAFALQWAVLSIYYGRLLPVEAHGIQWCSTALAYPLMHLLLTRLYHRMQIQ